MLGSNGRARALRTAAAALGLAFAALSGGNVALAASADAGASGFLQAASPPAAVPDGSTLVPSRQQFDESLGIAAPSDAASPQSTTTGSNCIPNFGSPSTGPSYVDGAVGPTKGIIVSRLGYLIFDKSNPAAVDCTGAFTSWDTLFGGLSYCFGCDFSDPQPRVIYDPDDGLFVLAALGLDGGDTFLNLATYAGTGSPSNVTGTTVASSPDTVDHLSLGYAQGYWTFALTVHGSSGDVGRVEFNDTGINFHKPLGSFPANIVAPVVLDNSGIGYYLAADTSSGSSVTRVAVNFAANTASTDTITVPAFSAPPPVTQSNGQKLDPGDGSFRSPTYQSGTSLWNVHTVNVDGHARVRLYKFSTSGTAPLMTFTPTIYGGDDLFNPSMATSSDAAGTKAFLSTSFAKGTVFSGQALVVLNGPEQFDARLVMGWPGQRQRVYLRVRDRGARGDRIRGPPSTRPFHRAGPPGRSTSTSPPPALRRTGVSRASRSPRPVPATRPWRRSRAPRRASPRPASPPTGQPSRPPSAISSTLPPIPASPASSPAFRRRTSAMLPRLR